MITETSDTHAGNDTIRVGASGINYAFGGAGNDVIFGGSDRDVLFGDNGVAVFADGSPEANDLWSTDPAMGGQDTIHGREGADIIIGGAMHHFNAPNTQNLGNVMETGKADGNG